MRNFLLPAAVSTAAILASLPAMAVCAPGQTLNSFPACESGHLEFDLASGTSDCFVVHMTASPQLWAVQTNNQVPTGDATAQMLIHGLLARLVTPGAVTTLIGAGGDVPCGVPPASTKQIGQVQ